MSVIDYNDPIITKRRTGNSDSPFVSISEPHQIENSAVVLSEIPSELERVKVTGEDITWYEKTEGIPSENEFVVDYVEGIVKFHDSRNGLQLRFDFVGTGLHYIPISRVFTNVENGDVVETLGDIIDNGRMFIDSENIRVANEDIRIISEAKRALDNTNRLSIGAYNVETQYKKYNEVTFNGSTWRALRDVKGVSPVEGVNWTLVARKGTDGNGVVGIYKETFVATQGQKNFTTQHNFDQFQNRTQVIVEGVLQKRPENYDELTSNTISFNEGLPAGYKVEITYFGEAIPIADDVRTVVTNHTAEINKFNNQGVYEEDFVATEGQTIFTLQTTYDQLQHKVEVWVDGLQQDSGDNFIESANNQITLTEGVPAGTEVKVRYFGKRIPVQTDVEVALNNQAATLGEHATTLNNHTNQLTDVNTQLAQTTTFNSRGGSFVDKMLGMIKTNGMYVSVDATNTKVGLNILDEQKSVIEYIFLKNTDNLLLLRGVKTGVTNEPYPAYTLNGNFITTNAPKIYTTTIGDSFTFEFEGTGFDFRRAIDPNGGMWEFRLNNGESKAVSCYSPTMNNYTRVPIFKDLDYGIYTVTATFLGQDPLHPVTTPRGYLMYDSTSVPPLNQPIIVHNNSKKINDTTAKFILSNNSIVDFAVSASPKGSGQNVEWVPQHGVVSGVSALIDRKVLIDGIVINPSTYKTYGNVKSFEIIQSFYALNPNGTSGNLWVHHISHKISVDKPYLEIANRLEFLQDTRIVAMYLTQLAAATQNVSRLALNDGTEYNSIPTTGEYVKFDKNVSSAMFSGNYATGYGHACAVDVLSYYEAAGLKKQPIDTKPVTMRFDTNGITKFYINAFIGDALTGDVFKNVQRISVINGVRSPNNLLKTM